VKDLYFDRPSSLKEALSLLETYAESARVIAGGTAMVPLLRQSLLGAERLISLQDVNGLSSIEEGPGGLRLGALVRHREVELSPLVRSQAPLLAEAYRRVGYVRLRNVATVGGGLAHADPCQDPPAAFLALGAVARVVSSRGERDLPVRELFSGYYETSLASDELIAGVVVPPQERDARFAYLKFLPGSESDYPTLGVAALGEVEGGTCTGLRVALVTAAPTPVRAVTVEGELVGRPVTTSSLRRAAEAVVEDIDPLSDFRGSTAYKRDMAVVWTRRALERVLLEEAG
jgi:aerobic carbon-monoxide dehydrogenase medium subunit